MRGRSPSGTPSTDAAQDSRVEAALLRGAAPEPAIRIPWFFRSRRRLLATIAAVLLVPLAVFAMALRGVNRGRMRQEIKRANVVAAELGASAVRAHFRGFASYAESYARRPVLASALAHGERDAVRDALRELIDSDPTLDRAFATSPTGTGVADWPESETIGSTDLSQSDWFRGVTTSNRTYVSEIYERTSEPRRLCIAVATPVHHAGTAPSGFLVVQVHCDDLARPLTRLAPAPGGSLRLIDQSGQMVSEDPAGGLRLTRLADTAILREPWNGEDVTIRDPVNGESSLVTRRPVEPFGWVVAAFVPERVATGLATVPDVGILVLSVVLFVALAFLSFLGSHVVREAHLASVHLHDLKDRLASMIVHDMRNPLTAITGNVELLAMSLQADPRFASTLQGAKASCAELMDLCQMLVDVTRLEEGQFPIHKAPVDLAEIARRKVEEYAAAAKGRSITLNLSAEGPAFSIEADPSVIERVVGNLVTNALKHTPSGGSVTVEVVPPGERNEAVLRVRDTGEGIPPDQLPRLFQRYGRAQGQKRVARSDTGLGLVFCKLAVEQHGGTIAVESKVGEGTTFTVRLPRSVSTRS